MHPESGELHLRDLDEDSARVIGMVLGQSVMLQYYEQQADKLQDVVQAINAQMLKGGLEQQDVLQLRGALATNSRMADLVAMSGQRDAVRPGTAAWRDPRYYELSQELSVDLELEERFEEIRHKLEFVMETIRFCLRERQEDAITRLEWLIVILLTLELFLTAGELRAKVMEAAAAEAELEERYEQEHASGGREGSGRAGVDDEGAGRQGAPSLGLWGSTVRFAHLVWKVAMSSPHQQQPHH